jgi:hypothetical protein
VKTRVCKSLHGICEPEIVEVEAPTEEENKPVRDRKAENVSKVAEKSGMFRLWM